MGTANFRTVSFGLFAFEVEDRWEWGVLEDSILDYANEFEAFNPSTREFEYYPDEYGQEDAYPIKLPLKFEAGYYSGMQVYVDYDERENVPQELDALISQDMVKLKRKLVELGAKRLICAARFSSGEAWYEEIKSDTIKD